MDLLLYIMFNLCIAEAISSMYCCNTFRRGKFCKTFNLDLYSIHHCISCNEVNLFLKIDLGGMIVHRLH